LFHFEYKIIFIYIGVRTFCPKAVAKMLENVGGASALLGLIAMATDVEELDYDKYTSSEGSFVKISTVSS
jgi:hypothetical protein